MFRVYPGYQTVPETVDDGTSRMGEIMVAPADLVRAFGPPGESDEHKVSGEWTFYNEKTGVIFTVYDWKMTSLYDEEYPSPEQLWSSEEEVQINIGGNHKGDVEEFKRLILQQIQWVKTGKPFEEQILNIPGGQSLFLLSSSGEGYS